MVTYVPVLPSTPLITCCLSLQTRERAGACVCGNVENSLPIEVEPPHCRCRLCSCVLSCPYSICTAFVCRKLVAMGVDITISTRQGACFAGDVIEGAVHVNVSAVRCFQDTKAATYSSCWVSTAAVVVYSSRVSPLFTWYRWQAD